MTIKIIAFGIAKDIIEGQKLELEIADQSSIADLKNVLCEKYPEFLKLRSLAFAVGENYQEDDFILNEKEEIVLIPPVSGG